MSGMFLVCCVENEIMADQQQANDDLDESTSAQPSAEPGSESFRETRADQASNEDEVLNKGEITNDDGSVVETLDTAFHNKPGMITDHSIAGSNRADYYEARSQGKSDSEEELDFLSKQPTGKEDK
jgi:hypothetical protein